MSLHIGNLSSDVHLDDLKHVFQKFGRCNVKIKDRYGFVVYDNPSSAEKALRTLRGTRFCGQAITLSWSNQQPHTLQRFGRGGKLYDPPRRKYFVTENADRRFVSNYRQEYLRDFKKRDGGIREHVPSNFAGASSAYNQDESKSHASRRDQSPLNDDSAVQDEHDRWEEQVEARLESGFELDRYDPYPSDDKKELDERENTSPLSRLPSSVKDQDRRYITYNKKLENVIPLQQVNPRSRSRESRDRKRNRRHFESSDKDNWDETKRPSSSSIVSDHTSSRSNLPQSDDDNLRTQNEMEDAENVDSVKREVPGTESDSFSNARNEAIISPREIYMVLQHYGLPCPKENEKDLPVELYFGSSRFWPWEIIYYRRLRKRIVSES